MKPIETKTPHSGDEDKEIPAPYRIEDWKVRTGMNLADCEGSMYNVHRSFFIN